MTSSNRVYLFDTTLRDGAQTQGVDFTVADKAAIARELDRLGIDYIEGGWPGANPTDDRFFADPPAFQSAKFVAFGMTRRAGRSAANDPGLNAILQTKARHVCMVGKTWDFHVDVALELDRSEYVDMIGDSIAHAKGRMDEVMFDAEHFFDGYKANPDYAMACLKAAEANGARWLVLCDTNGGTLPHEIERIVGEVAQKIPGERLGIHTHNDTENAVANSLAAVRAGVRQVQGTINGLGERCGNANMISLIPNLVLKMGFDTGLKEGAMARLTHLSRLLDDRLNVGTNRSAAYVGTRAFAHKGGLHVSAVEKDPRTYEHVDPETVGNQRIIVVSDQAGRSNIMARFRQIGLEVDPKDPGVARLLEIVKEREAEGYAYDGADASFELLARHELHTVPDYFALQSFRVLAERRVNARGQLIALSEATVKLDVAGRRAMEVGEGNGPVNALDAALRKALVPVYPELADMRLVDFKVRILDSAGGTAATTRVMIESADAKGRRWSTIGVSPNIVDASYNALYDAITYKLFRDGAAPAAGGTVGSTARPA
ncbi:MAG TPA: citramalate synthase [Reyranella sp.]|nr:citramalate synthase [Reyranella sp.]